MTQGFPLCCSIHLIVGRKSSSSGPFAISTMTILKHPLLGAIKGKVTNDLVQYLGIPYASISRRFARSTTLLHLPNQPFDATESGPESVQPEHATEADAKGNQFPHDGFKEQPQSEVCLSLNITVPTSMKAALPVVVFIHGGAFFLGSSSRPYYSPINFLSRAVHTDRPVVFVAINYRLSALGFLHSPEATDILPPNNALHDQLGAFEWIHRNIAGFGGDPARITAIGQSAGGMSLALHSVSGNPDTLFQQMICLSGTPVTMPSKTPQQYHETFLSLAGKLKLSGTTAEMAQGFIDAPVDKIRDLSYVGAPCCSSELLPYAHPSMAQTHNKASWLKRAIYSSATYDGGVSYNMLTSRKGSAMSFIKIARNVLSTGGAEQLLALYNITEDDDDKDALEKICQFESDIGFFCASQAQAANSPAAQSYLQLYDLKNPFDAGGHLAKDKFATHTWDIVSLLGCYDDLVEDKLAVIQDWRDKLLGFIYGDEPWDEYDKDGRALRVDHRGIAVETVEGYMGEDHGRRKRLVDLAEREKGVDGRDLLWEGVCRKWLDS